MQRRSWVLLGAGGAGAVALLAWAFAPRPVDVEVAAVTIAPFEVTIDEEAKTRLAERYVVSAPLAGRLSRITLREGDTVGADAVVATLTPVLPPLLDERAVRELGARAEAAQASLQRSAARIEATKVAQQQARNELKRSEQLARDGFIAPTKLDTDQLSVSAAQKEVDAAIAEQHVATHEREVARAALSALRPGASGARAFSVRSPVMGRVLRIAQTSEGSVNVGAPLLEIGDTSRLEIVAELLTTDALQAQPGARVRVERWGGAGVLEGRVRHVEPAAFTKVSALGVEEQRVNVLIDLASPVEQWKALGDGYRVSVRIVTTAQANAVQVPASAVFPRPDGAMAVFVLDGARARLTPIVLGARNGSSAWVRSGLAAGQRVIVYPPASVSDGARVKLRAV